MLQSIRQITHSWIVKSLMLFLIISFSIWGIGDIFRGNPSQKTLAKVGDVSISVQDLTRLFDEILVRARQSSAPDLTATQARQMGLLDKALDNEIKRQLIDQDIRRRHIDVSSEEVLKVLSEQPQFRTKDGIFNADLFRRLLEQQHLTEGGFVTQGKHDLSRQVLLAALSGSHVAPESMTDTLYKARGQKRVLDIVSIDVSKMGAIPAPADKPLLDFYASHAASFVAPEYRAITIVSLSTDTLAKEMVISDDQIKKEYDAKIESLSHPEQRDIVQVVMQDEAEAKQLAQQARAAKDISAAAKPFNETPVPLDKMEEKNLLPELSKAVFALHEGGVTDPVKTQLGWHVVQVKKIIPAGKPEFAKLKDKLREDMRHDQAIESATRMVNQMDDQLAAGHPLDDIATDLKLHLVKIPAIDATGLTPDGKAPAELPNKAQILKDAFAQIPGDSSPIEDDKAGNYYIVRTDDVTPSGTKPFDKIRADVVAAWKVNEQKIRAENKGKKIEQMLREGKPLAAIAHEDAVSVRSSAPLSRLGDTDASLPQDIIDRAFWIKKGDVFSTFSDNKQMIVRLASLQPVDATKDDPRKTTISADIRQNASEELLTQYLRHLHDVFSVAIDADMLDKMRKQGD